MGAGESHDAWGVNRSLRVMQAVSNSDFAVDAGFDSVPSATNQDQGLIVEQDASNWLRFDVFSSGGVVRAFAASTTNGTSKTRFNTVLSVQPADSVVVGVSRAGNAWTMTVAVDGGAPQVIGTFSQALTVGSVGPFAANAGSKPAAYTALVDYVFDRANPITPEDGGAAPDPDPDPDPEPEPDVTAPVVSGLAATPAASSATVSWTTNEATTGAVAFGTTTSYGSSATSTGSGTSHSVTLTGLAPATTYHYRVTATDTSGNAGSSADLTFTTTAASAPNAVLLSDDFSGAVLGSGWSVVDPVGDGSVELVGQGTGDAYLALSVGAGESHDAWGVNRSLRVMQAVSNSDFAVDAGFDSVPSATNQDQGLIVEQDASNWLRFDVFSSGGVVRAFAASTTNGTSKTRFNTVLSVQPADSVVVGVSRAGNAWTMTVAVDGGAPQVIGTFSQALTVGSVGPFAANAGSKPAAYTALVDYVFDRANPITPEDGGAAPDPDPDPDPEPEPDVTAPVVSGLAATPAASSATVSWTTNEATTGAVAFGTTTSYGSSATSTGSGTSHSVTLTGLAPATTYHYRVTATDTSGNATVTQDRVFTTPAQTDGIAIDVWYGPDQVFGAPARTQPRVNIVGSVSDPASVTSLTYRVNGGAARNLSIGPDNRRLSAPGDFNVDIPYADLSAGANGVTITALGSDGSSVTETVNVTVQTASSTLPYATDWSAGESLQAQAQSVDGLWEAGNGSVSTVQVGYDRILAVGDATWTDYEVTVPMTLHGFGPGAGQYLSGAAMIGVGLRWQGHTQLQGEQPGYGWYPAGAYSWYRFYDEGPRWELFGNNNSPVNRGPRNAVDFSPGDTFVMRVRVESLPTGGAVYSMRMWEQGTVEPTTWFATITDDDTVANGSVVLIAHHVDATFGNVTVTPLE
ncbi:fibronectin type III domain-containing protein [Occultella gossypii]|uniref:Fibronectin type III domain-containing protein n=1 Tax=Occultella gossypii TaxID=2800820 RepID=A0ABS7S8R8_9MICO|nr:fibronectin type III domain-containing protein [Occultella gossypii]MBZ2196744.1 fibronectin type III domain-containing protein [Occultella gossypii]